MKILDWLKNQDPTLHKNINTSEQQVVDIFQELLINPKTELHYDPDRYECFLECEPYFMVMGAGKVIIVNSIYSHEVKLSRQTEVYISFTFNKEVSKRRQALKFKYLSKVERNLGNILESVKKLS